MGTITHKRSGGTTFETLTYAYDANGNRTTLTDATGSTTFGYDALNRLTSTAYPGTYGIWSWTYDQVGNRLTQNSPSGQTNYGYDANNRLTSAGGATYSYDNNGNLTSISTGTSFTYDAHNRMSQANLPGGLVVQYTYNGDGLKIRRIEGSVVTRYYHDGIRPLYEAKGDGSRNADLERDIFGNLLARQDAGGARFYYHHDGLGSTVGLTNASGAVAAQRSYDAWGNRRTSSGSAPPGSYQFTGAELDPTSGLYHMGARFYDPTVGRWLSEDPVQLFHPVALNFYSYVGNNPMIFTDSTGTCDQQCLEVLNRQRQELAKLAIELAKLTGQKASDIYGAARKATRAAGFEKVRDALIGAVATITDAGSLVATTAQPDVTGVGNQYLSAFRRGSAAVALFAIAGILATAGQENAAAVFLGLAVVTYGLAYNDALTATNNDRRYFNGQVWQSLPAEIREVITRLGLPHP